MQTERLRQLLVPGAVVGARYRIERYVASGGFGDVYAARHTVLESAVAIKVLRVEKLATHDAPTQVASFLDEARLLARVRHPHIVTVLDAGVTEETSQPWIALEWCDGRTLRDAMMADPRPRSPEAAWQLLKPIADALATTHRAGVIHRDVKPSNVLLWHDGARMVPKLVDFGIGKLVGDEPLSPDASQSRGAALGFSPAYAAPEQVTGSPTGPWTDIHALGLLFVELVSAREAYDRSYPLESALAAERPNLPELGVASFAALDDVIARTLARDPRLRFGSIGELTAAFDAILPPPERSSITASTSRPAGSSPTFHRGVDPTLAATYGGSPKGRIIETSPSARAISRDTGGPRSARPGLGVAFGIGAMIVAGLTVASGLVAHRRGWLHLPGIGAPSSATSLRDAGAESAPTAEASAPGPSAAALSPSASPPIFAPPGTRDYPRATLLRDRHLGNEPLVTLLGRAHALHFETSYEGEAKAASENQRTFAVTREGCQGTVIYRQVLDDFAAPQIIDGTVSVTAAPAFLAVDGHSILIMSIAGENGASCTADLAGALAPRK